MLVSDSDTEVGVAVVSEIEVVVVVVGEIETEVVVVVVGETDVVASLHVSIARPRSFLGFSLVFLTRSSLQKVTKVSVLSPKKNVYHGPLWLKSLDIPSWELSCYRWFCRSTH